VNLIGFRAWFANDLWDAALDTFLMNFDATYRTTGGDQTGDIVPLRGSIENLDPSAILASLRAKKGRPNMGVGDLDVLLGGPPCQGYSINSHTRNAEDPRNHLFRHYVRLLRGLAPKVRLAKS
jgi:DNA (cytosine-5)-methyltransferase 1